MSKRLQKIIWEKSNGACAHCGRIVLKASDRTMDHVIPKILGGTNDQRNLMPLCRKCNEDRANDDIIPGEYYCYTSESSLDDLNSYIIEWKAAHTRFDGTLTASHYGIIDEK